MSEAVKLGAFVRRDFLTALTYKAGFIGDWFALALSAFLFYFTGLLVDPSTLPSFDGSPATYLEFVIIGVGLGLFVQIALNRVAAVMRQEQFAGTLESLLMTPTTPLTVQLGSVMYDLLFIPIRISLFVTVVAVGFGLDLKVAGVAPALIYLAAIVPFVWGLGMISAGITMTFRRGGGLVELGAGLLVLGGGAYFPLTLFPDVLQNILATANPVAIAITGMRDGLLGGEGWQGLPSDLALLAPMAAVSLLVGNIAFRLGVRRERQRGTLGLY